MKNAKELIYSMCPGQVAILSDDFAFTKPVQSDIVMDLCNKGYNVLYLSTNIECDDCFYYIDNEEGYADENIDYEDLELEYQKGKIFPDVYEQLISNKVNDRKFDYIFIHDPDTVYKASNPTYKSLLRMVVKAARQLEVPIICGINIEYNPKEEEIKEVLDDLYENYNGIADIIILASYVSQVKIKMLTLDLRNVMTENDYYTLGDSRLFIPNNSKFEEFYKNAESLGLNEVDAFNYAKNWYEDNGKE